VTRHIRRAKFTRWNNPSFPLGYPHKRPNGSQIFRGFAGVEVRPYIINDEFVAPFGSGVDSVKRGFSPRLVRAPTGSFHRGIASRLSFFE
jgi:hypothetical protein